jgi:hypothetical protein
MFIFELVNIPKNPRIEKNTIKVGMIEEKGYPRKKTEEVKIPDISLNANRVDERNRTTAISSITDCFECISPIPFSPAMFFIP